MNDQSDPRITTYTRFPKPLHQRIKQWATKHNISSVNAAVNILLTKQLDHEDQSKPEGH